MSHEPDIEPDRIDLKEADRACREIKGEVERARRRLLREYRDIIRERPSDHDWV